MFLFVFDASDPAIRTCSLPKVDTETVLGALTAHTPRPDVTYQCTPQQEMLNTTKLRLKEKPKT